MRGVAHIEEVQPGKGRHKRNAVVITELPYQLSKAGWIEKLAEQVNDGKVAGIADIRDESDRDGMRVVVELRRDANPEQVLAQLHKRTALQNNFGAILLALVNGQPIQLSLRQMLQQFLEYRELTMMRRTRYALRRCEERLEVVEGLIKALDDLAKVIQMIQDARDAASAKASLQVHRHGNGKPTPFSPCPALASPASSRRACARNWENYVKSRAACVTCSMTANRCSTPWSVS